MSSRKAEACDGEGILLQRKLKDDFVLERRNSEGNLIRLPIPPVFPKGTIKPSKKKMADCEHSLPPVKMRSSCDGKGVPVRKQEVECRDSEGKVISLPTPPSFPKGAEKIASLPTPPLFPKGSLKPSEIKKAKVVAKVGALKGTYYKTV